MDSVICKKVHWWLFTTLAMVVVTVLFLVKRYFDSIPEVSEDYVVALLDRVIDGTAHAYDWDGFLNCPLKNPKLEAVRKACIKIDEKHHSEHKDAWVDDEGRRLLEGLAHSLREEDI